MHGSGSPGRSVWVVRRNREQQTTSLPLLLLLLLVLLVRLFFFFSARFLSFSTRLLWRLASDQARASSTHARSASSSGEVSFCCLFKFFSFWLLSMVKFLQLSANAFEPVCSQETNNLKVRDDMNFERQARQVHNSLHCNTTIVILQNNNFSLAEAKNHNNNNNNNNNTKPRVASFDRSLYRTMYFDHTSQV